jgi:hypothetical protein
MLGCEVVVLARSPETGARAPGGCGLTVAPWLTLEVSRVGPGASGPAQSYLTHNLC